jgi:hypothetical protein
MTLNFGVKFGVKQKINATFEDSQEMLASNQF